MRNYFDKQLNRLHTDLINMGALCEQAIAISAKALLDKDLTLVEKVMETEEKIDQMEADIETLCMKLLLRQQPVAGDLRAVSSALRMIADMERIGDMAADIAEIVRYYDGSVGHQSVSHIGDMARATIKMVTDSVESFVQTDIEMARSVIAYDDTVDRLFDQVKDELIEAIGKDPQNGGRYLDLLMIAKYFERIGDHATNVAEWVCFSISGEHK